MSDLYFGHMSTDQEVKTLLDNFTEVPDGLIITHDEIVALTQLDASSSRYRTVTTRWRKIMLAQFNVELRARANVGFVALPPADRVTANIDDGLRLFKRVDATVGRMKQIPREGLEHADVVRVDHATVLMARVADTAKQVKVALAPPKPHRLLVDRVAPT